MSLLDFRAAANARRDRPFQFEIEKTSILHRCIAIDDLRFVALFNLLIFFKIRNKKNIVNRWILL